jgi:hypothetical protein
LLGWLGASAPGGCLDGPDGEAAAQITRIARTAESLRQVPVEDMDTDVPEAVRPLLTRLKHELLDLVGAQLATAGERPAAAMQEKLIEELRLAGVQLDAEGKSRNDEMVSQYGDVLELRIEEPPAHPELLTVAITLGITCGSDTSLYLFRKESSGWQLILAREANDYATVAGAQNLYDYELSPPEPGGGFFLATASINAWCTSNWQSMRLEVLRPGPSPSAPRVLLDERQTVFGQDYTLRILDRDVVSLLFQGNQRLDLGIMVRDHVLRYKVAGDDVERIPPLAGKPEDFLDEWLDLPWSQAQRWSAPGLEDWHDQLAGQAHDYTLEGSGLHSSPAGRPGRWWVQLCLDGEDLPAGLYFLISQKGDVYRVEEVSTTQPTRLALDEAETCGADGE